MSPKFIDANLGTNPPESWSKDFEDCYIIESRYRSVTPNCFSTNFGQPFGVVTALGSTHFIGKKGKELELSFSSEVIIGWRAWKIVDYKRRGDITEKRLQAIGMNVTWEPYRPNVAICTQDGGHEAPWPECNCGFWIFKDREHVERAMFDQYGGEKGKVIGQTAVWGRVLECTRGYRGEFAYPQTLQFIEVEDEIAKAVSATYGVPYSIAERSTKLKCNGAYRGVDYDFDRCYATVEYQCGLILRVEISKHFMGKSFFDFDKVPPCPEHHN